MSPIRLIFLTIPRENVSQPRLNLRYRVSVYGQIFEYLRCLPGVNASFFDAWVIDLSLDETVEELRGTEPDLLVLWCDVEDAPAAKKLAARLKQVLGDTKILVIGNAPAWIPQYFERFPFDAVWLDGDFETSVESYIQFLCSADPSLVSGLSFSDKGSYTRKTTGSVLPFHKLALPNLYYLPIDLYRRRWTRYRPKRPFELTVGPVRGCTRHCRYCEVPRVANGAVRSVDSQKVYDWLEENLHLGDMVQLVAPNIAADKQWLTDFSLLAASSTFIWKAAVTLSDLDEELIALMANGHCKYLAYGVETLSARTTNSPKISLSELRRFSALLGDRGIKQKAFVMIGCPGQTKDDVRFTLETLLEMGVSIRPTGYTPFQKLTRLDVDTLDRLDLHRYDKQTFYDPSTTTIGKEVFWKIMRGEYQEALQELHAVE